MQVLSFSTPTLHISSNQPIDKTTIIIATAFAVVLGQICTCAYYIVIMRIEELEVRNELLLLFPMIIVLFVTIADKL